MGTNNSHSAEKVWSSVKLVFILLFQIVKPSRSEQNGSQSWKLGRTQQPIGVCWRQVGCDRLFCHLVWTLQNDCAQTRGVVCQHAQCCVPQSRRGRGRRRCC